ncbi:MAG: hypothetical protein EBR82_56425, partial [Caulobacteraceae bacterium]|nr:hypothetical protein [Caulobacteraceae bacterium]
MPRNASGTYSLPAGNPVVPGATIQASWANTTMDDLANEITNSLSRTGAGGMLAPFRIADGTVSAPGLAFTNETNSGLYRNGSGSVWMTILGVNVAQFSTTGLTIPSGKALSVQNATVAGTLAVTGATTLSSTLGVTGATTLSSTLGVTGAVNLSSTLGVLGAVTLSSTLSVTGAITASGGVNGNVTGNVTGNLSGNVSTASGTSTFNNVTVAGALAVTGGTITGLVAPTNDNEAANKAYVDTVAQGLDAKASCLVATTANITLSGTQTIDGVAVTAGQRVLVKDQSTQSQNGIYVCVAGAWTRATDADTWAELIQAFTFIEQGSTNANNGFVCTIQPGGTLGSTAVTWAQFSGAGQIDAGAGLTKTGNQLNVGTASASRIVVNADNIDLGTTGVTAGTYKSVTVDLYGRVTGGTNPTTLAGYGISDAYTIAQVDAIFGSTTSAAASAAAAASSASSAATSLTNFRAQYVGPSAFAPSTDGNGNALTAGDLYFDTSIPGMRVYNAATSSWSTIQQGITNTQTDEPTIRPSLLLDFANTERLDPRVTFVRTTTATYYDGVTTAMAEQNLLTYSQDFSNAAWIPIAMTITTDSTTAPDGSSTADTITPTTTNTYHRINQPIPGSTTGLTVTYSVYVKANGYNYIALRESASVGGAAVFNLSAGGSVAGYYLNPTYVSGAVITDVGNGWFRISAQFFAVSSQSIGIYVLNSWTSGDPQGVSFAGNGTSGVYLWGAQVEVRSSVTAYTATTTQAITNYIPVLQTAAAGVARFDHNPTTGESLGLLIEEQRTNVFTYSADFSDSIWAKGNSSVTANTIVAPDGTLTGDKLVENTATGSHNIVQNYTGTATLTSSVYAKPAGRSAFVMNGGNQSGVAATFDVSAGTVSNVGGAVTGTSITSVGNGWYRCSMTWSNTSTVGLGIFLVSGGSASYTGDGFSGLYLWGAQLEAGSFATSYIPTT